MEHDLDRATDLCRRLEMDEDTLAAFMEYARLAARLQIEQNTDLVDALAETLVDRITMSGPSVRALLQEQLRQR